MSLKNKKVFLLKTIRRRNLNNFRREINFVYFFSKKKQIKNKIVIFSIEILIIEKISQREKKLRHENK